MSYIPPVRKGEPFKPSASAMNTIASTVNNIGKLGAGNIVKKAVGGGVDNSIQCFNADLTDIDPESVVSIIIPETVVYVKNEDGTPSTQIVTIPIVTHYQGPSSHMIAFCKGGIKANSSGSVITSGTFEADIKMLVFDYYRPEMDLKYINKYGLLYGYPTLTNGIMSLGMHGIFKLLFFKSGYDKLLHTFFARGIFQFIEKDNYEGPFKIEIRKGFKKKYVNDPVEPPYEGFYKVGNIRNTPSSFYWGQDEARYIQATRGGDDLFLHFDSFNRLHTDSPGSLVMTDNGLVERLPIADCNGTIPEITPAELVKYPEFKNPIPVDVETVDEEDDDYRVVVQGGEISYGNKRIVVDSISFKLPKKSIHSNYIPYSCNVYCICNGENAKIAVVDGTYGNDSNHFLIGRVNVTPTSLEADWEKRSDCFAYGIEQFQKGNIVVSFSNRRFAEVFDASLRQLFGER